MTGIRRITFMAEVTLDDGRIANSVAQLDGLLLAKVAFRDLPRFLEMESKAPIAALVAFLENNK